jgi:hypothetical protein
MRHFKFVPARRDASCTAVHAHRFLVLTSPDSDGKIPSDIPSFYSDIKSAYLAGHVSRLMDSLSALDSYCQHFSFDLDGIFVDLSLHSVLLEIAISFEKPLCYLSLSIMRELSYTRSNGFADFFVNAGFLPPLSGLLSETKDDLVATGVVHVLTNIVYCSREFVAALYPYLSLPGLMDRLQLSLAPVSGERQNALPLGIVCLMALVSEVAPIADVQGWLDALNYLVQCELFRDCSAVYLLFLARRLCTDRVATVNVSRISALVDLMNEILEQLPEDRVNEGCGVVDLLRVFAFYFGPNPEWFPAELQMQWAIKGLQSEDAALFETTAAFICEGCEHLFLRRLFLATDVMGGMRKRIEECAFASRVHLAGAAIALVRDATVSQIESLIRAGASAVVAQGLGVDVLRRDAFLAMSWLLRYSWRDDHGRDIVVAQFVAVGGLDLLDAVREDIDRQSEDVCLVIDEFLAAYEERDGGEEEG